MLYDKDIREPLAFYLEEIYGKNRILEEQVMGQSRADMVMVVHDALYGIEIKSDADSYARLDRQVKDYNLYYDYDLVVVGTRHAAHIKEHVPEWWGIITVEQVGDQVDFYMLREPQSNPQMDWNCKIEILWRPELAHIQELNAMHAYKQKSKRFVARCTRRRPRTPDLRHCLPARRGRLRGSCATRFRTRTSSRRA